MARPRGRPIRDNTNRAAAVLWFRLPPTGASSRMSAASGRWGPDRARHCAHVGSEQWRRAWLCAARTPCGAELATAGGHGRRGPGAVAVPGGDGSLAKRPATGTRLGLCGEGTAPPQRDTPAVVGRVSRRQSRRLWLYLVLHDL